MMNDQTFARSRLCEVLADLPSGSAPVEYVGEGLRKGGRDGVAVEFLPGSPDQRWTGVFARGDLALRAQSGIVVLPDQRVLVVARGTGYVVAPARRSPPTVIGPNPIVDLLVVQHARLVLVADPWSVSALGDHGLAWATGRIALDGLLLKGASGGQAFGEVHVAGDESRPFSIDLASGECTGAERLTDR